MKMRSSYNSTFQKRVPLTPSLKQCTGKTKCYCMWCWGSQHNQYLHGNSELHCFHLLPSHRSRRSPCGYRMLKDTQQPPPGVKTRIPVRVSGYFVTPGYHFISVLLETQDLGLGGFAHACIHLGWALYVWLSEEGTGMKCTASHVTVTTKRTQLWYFRAEIGSSQDREWEAGKRHLKGRRQGKTSRNS